MSNIASSYMRIRGTRENCESFIWEIPADTDIIEKHGTKKDSMYEICGECDNGMKYSFFGNTDSSLEKCAAKCNVEFEAFCSDLGEPTWFEHCHYKGAECLAHDYFQQVYSLNPDDVEEEWEDRPSPEILERYYDHAGPSVYILKDEYLICSYDEETGSLDCQFTMSFDDLK